MTDRDELARGTSASKNARRKARKAARDSRLSAAIAEFHRANHWIENPYDRHGEEIQQYRVDWDKRKTEATRNFVAGWTAREARDRVVIKTIGHVDNEKTALTAAIAQAAQTNPEDPKP